MTKQNTKRALLMSALSLLLCVSMLIGSTYAWFTDSVTSGNNKIVAGNLKVDLLMADANGTYTSIADKDAAIFGANSLVAQNNPADTLWEPGKTQIVYLGVQNKGNLDLKYNILLNVTDGGLVGSLEYAIVDGADATTNKINATSWEDVKAITNAQTGDVVAGTTVAAPNGAITVAEKTEYFALAVHMKEEAGNQYQGKDITIDVTVLATQLASESDSFNNQYDVPATYMNKNADGKWEIESLGQLIYFAQQVNGGNSYAGETVVLTKDIDLKGINWTPIGDFTYDINTNGDGYVYGKSFKGTFDGQGHTIKNLYVNSPNTSGVGLFGYVTDATIKNLTIDNVKLEALSHAAAFVARARGTSTVNNCKLTGDIDINAYWAYVAGIVGKAYAINLDNCTVTPDGIGEITSENRNAVGSILAWMETASTVSNCKAQGLDLTGWANIGGITGFVSGKSAVTNCAAENITITKTRIDGHPSVGLISGGWNGKDITIKNNTAKGITLNGSAVVCSSANILYGSEFYGSLDNTGFVLDNNVQENIENNLIYGNSAVKVATATELNDALNGATSDVIIIFTNDIAGNVTLNQNVNIDLVINGNGHKFDGSINIKAASTTDAAGSITFKDIAFKTDATELSFISSTETNHYPLNVTVSGCSFEGTGANSKVVGITVKSAKNFVIENCTANNVHSLLQNTSGWNLTVRDVTVTNSGRGFALGTVQGISLTNVKVEAAKYGIRMDAGYNNNAVITDCNVTAFIPVVVRRVSVNSNVTFNGTNTMTQTNTDGIWCAIGTSEYEENGVLPTVAVQVVTVTVNDAGLNTAGIYNNSGK